MNIEWDEEKRLSNVAKHAVDFVDAWKLFSHPYLEKEDARKEYGEKRFSGFGYIEGRLMVVTFTRRGDSLRIISLRKANEREQKRFKAAVADRLDKDRLDAG
jgi:uncharacterized DUF497 family protein